MLILKILHIIQDVLKLNAFGAVKYALENYTNKPSYTLSNYSSNININKVVSNDASYFDEENDFYDFKLTATDSNGNEIEYPLGALTIKDEDGIDVIDKFSLNGYENEAITKENKNSLSALLDSTGYYRVYINLDTNNLSSLILEITEASH